MEYKKQCIPLLRYIVFLFKLFQFYMGQNFNL